MPIQTKKIKRLRYIYIYLKKKFSRTIARNSRTVVDWKTSTGICAPCWSTAYSLPSSWTWILLIRKINMK
jgi:hypothetical protein